MYDWGLYVSDKGVLHGDYTGVYDHFQYYHGKLKGKERLLHYVNLFIQWEKNEVRLPELLTMQSRIMLEILMEDGLPIQSHGCFISEEFLAENRPANFEQI